MRNSGGAGGWRGWRDAAFQQVSGASERLDSAACSLLFQSSSRRDGFDRRLKFFYLKVSGAFKEIMLWGK